MGISASAYDAAIAVTASDTTNDPGANVGGGTGFAGMFTGSGGTIKFTDAAGNVATWQNVAAGVILPMRFLRVWTSVTTATGVFGLIAR